MLAPNSEGKSATSRFCAIMLLAALFAAAFLAAASAAPAQTPASLSGTIRDAAGRAIEGAWVTLSGGPDRRSRTDAAGAYRFSDLLPGMYTLTVSASQFKTFEEKSLVLSAGSTLQKDLVLQVDVSKLEIQDDVSPRQIDQKSASAAAQKSQNESNAELQSAISEFSRREEDLPKGPTPRTAKGRPDLSGYWVPSTKDRPVGNLGKDFPGYKLPFTEAGRAALKYNVEHTIDPESLCIVGGIPRHDASALPFQLLEGEDHVVFLYWYTTYRLIPTDGRKHSADPDPSFFGEEVGTWEGDTLVIDSIAFKDQRTWADENANPHSDQMHVIERWTRPDLGHLHLELTVIDPKFYTEPIHYQRTWLLGKPGDHVQEYSCAEENVDAPHLQPGPGKIGPNGERGFDELAPLPPPPDPSHPAKTSIPE